MKKKASENKYFDNIVGAMLFIVVGIMPLVVRAVLRAVPPDSLDVWAGTQSLFDPIQMQQVYVNSFSHWKFWLLSLPAAVIAFYIISDWATGGYKKVNMKKVMKDPVVIAAAVFLFFSLASALFSNYAHTAWFGTRDRAEGMLAWFAYFTVFLGAMIYVRKLKYTYIIIWGLIFSSIGMGLIGLTQVLGNSLFETDLGSRVVTGGLLRSPLLTGAEISIRFEMAFGTLFNPNTFGLYTAMMAPLMIILGVCYEGKRWVNALLFVAGGLMVVGLFGSRSLAGFVGIAAALGVIAVTLVCFILRRGIRRIDWYFIAVSAGVVAVLIAASIFVTPINERLSVQWERFTVALRGEPRPVHDYIFDGNTMTVYFDDTLLFTARIHEEIHPVAGRITEETTWITIYDALGNEVPLRDRTVIEADTRYRFDIPGHGHASFMLREGQHFRYRNVLFIQIEGTIYGVTQSANFEARTGLVDMSEQIPAWGFRGRETWGSGRGYIFSRTFPLMPRTAIIGSGPDTYANVFPNHDLMGKALFMQSPYQLIDKGHNIILHTWIGHGGIATLALIFLLGYYLITTFISLLRDGKNKTRFVFGLQLGILACVAAFFIASLSTDSTIGSTGVFFVILGLGYGVNRLS
ncbi:MAG: O-antigen ligase family protein [Defluviitaleaceae bacterium]|nr:O-antigen ligase family protein [Defluviitaleaceae bacterium]